MISKCVAFEGNYRIQFQFWCHRLTWLCLEETPDTMTYLAYIPCALSLRRFSAFFLSSVLVLDGTRTEWKRKSQRPRKQDLMDLMPIYVHWKDWHLTFTPWFPWIVSQRTRLRTFLAWNHVLQFSIRNCWLYRLRPSWALFFCRWLPLQAQTFV